MPLGGLLFPLELAVRALDGIAERQQRAQERVLQHREMLVDRVIGAVGHHLTEERRLREERLANDRARDESLGTIIQMLIMVIILLIGFLYWNSDRALPLK